MDRLFTVTQLNSYIHGLLEQDIFLRGISVEGEVSNVSYNQRGHIYFTLKDEASSIPAVMWASYARLLTFRIGDGDKVKVRGKITTYEKSGAIQISVVKLEPAGRGELFARFEEIKNELGEMGMFAEEYKKPIPGYVRSIGVITSPTGSAVQDICKISKARYPGIQITVYPAKVQGEGAADSIVRGIEILDEMGFDVIIVGRGGGSMEDLWCFNEESVARAIFNAMTPIISAVGHQDDYTIADLVADVRASTPSNAAELAVFDYSRLLDELSGARRRMELMARAKLTEAENHVHSLGLRLRLYSPKGRLEQSLQHADELGAALDRCHPRHLIERRREELFLAAKRLEYLSPVKKLASGFSYVTDAAGRNVSSYLGINEGDDISIRLSEGSLRARVTEVIENA